MSNVGNILLEKDILLESGTNELEVLLFNVADFSFGINVAKVREVLPATEITQLPRAHRSVRGVFKLRDQVIPCVSLIEHLGIQPTRDESESKLILTDFNQQQTAFFVDDVERIHRLTWENVLAVPGLVALSSTPVTALARCGERLVVMLDFEMIIDQVTYRSMQVEAIANPHDLPRGELHVLVADDSPTVRHAIGNTLRSSGYDNLTFFENGAEAWKWIEDRLESGHPLAEIGDVLISDVEMPQIDGLHLTKRIKQHPQLNRLPVLLYSSIVTPDNKKKGQAVGADAQVSKPELERVVQLADDLILAARQNSQGDEPGNRPTESAGDTPAASAGTSAPSPPAVVADRPATANQTKSPASSPDASTAHAHREAVSSTPADQATPSLAKGSPAPQPAAAPKRAEPPSSAASEADSASPANQPPSTPVDVPSGGDAQLWQAFRDELIELVEGLESCIRQRPTEATAPVVNQTLRLLHSIKSCASVVPQEAVRTTTHMMESIVEAFGQSRRAGWPEELLAGYAEWLRDIGGSPDLTASTAVADFQLEADLAAELVALAG